MMPEPAAEGRPRRAWVLNLDAEHELAAGGRYAPTRHLAAIVARESRRLLGDLVAPGDVVLRPDAVARGEQSAAGLEGLAWSPTPRALALLEAAGARPPGAPPLGVLREVNARSFAAAVRAPLAGPSFAKRLALDLEQALALLSQPAPAGWLVRRAFGAAGRGRRRVTAGPQDQPTRAWLAAGLRGGPLVVEPWVEVTREYTRSGWVHRDGRVEVAAPCFQATDAAGAWTRTERAARGEVRQADDRRLERAAARAGAALARAGYFGPFGIDAFRHRALAGPQREVLNPLSEINARFTMDWTRGISPGARLQALEGLRQEKTNAP